MENGQISLWIPDEPDRDIQTLVEESTCGTAPYCNEATCQVEIVICSQSPYWKLISRDENGEPKRCGGDEFYVRYEEFVDLSSSVGDDVLTYQAVALIQDQKDGSYNLDFVSTPMHPIVPADNYSIGSFSKRILTVYFKYTNGIGTLPPPTKNKWPNGGYTHRCFTKTVTSLRPKIRPFQSPVCPVDLGSFDRVLAFGDSTMDQFVRQRPNKKGKYYFQPNILVGEKIRQPLNSNTVSGMLEMLEKNFGDLIRLYISEGKHVCLVLGSCLWDILDASDSLQGAGYEDHMQACKDFVSRIRKRYPVIVTWKSPTAVHIHWVDLERLIEHDKTTATLFGRDRVRYMSESRSKFLYDCQQKVMQELDVPLLDIYEASYLSADQLYPSDGRHYRPDLNRLMLSWFGPTALRDKKYYQNGE